jgi:hypothetical protein
LIALILIIFSPVKDARGGRLQAPVRLRERTRLHAAIDFDQHFQQFAHTGERPGIRSVGQRPRRVRMRLHEQPGNAGRGRRTRQHGNELPLPTGGASPAARQLHGMGGIENHRATGIAQHRQAAHVGHQVVVAEREAALADQDVVVAGRAGLVDDVPHLPGREKLPLLDVHRSSLRRDVDDEIRLPAEESRCLQDVDDGRDFGQGRVFVHIRQHRNAQLLLHLAQDPQALIQARAAETLARAAIRLVE